MPTPVGISSKPVVQTGRAPGNVDPASTMYAENRHSPGVVWMIVGGAGLITGLIIDQPVITIAGALVMLYGIYLAVR
jgi:hypothetical protein